MGDRERRHPTESDFARGYRAGRDECQQSAEASGAKDQAAPSHADSRKGKTDRITGGSNPGAARPKVVNAVDKLQALLVKGLQPQSGIIFKSDVVRLLRDNWLEISWYAHAIHNKLEAGEDPYEEL